MNNNVSIRRSYKGWRVVSGQWPLTWRGSRTTWWWRSVSDVTTLGQSLIT